MDQLPNQDNQDNQDSQDNQPDRFENLLKKLRWLLILYIPAMGFAVLMGLVYGLYGLAHSGGGSLQYVIMLGLGALVFGLSPLTLLSRKRSSGMRAIQGLGMMILCIGTVIFSRLLSYLFIEPEIWAFEFRSVVKSVAIERVAEAPYLDPVTGVTPIGLLVTTDIRLHNDILLDRNGKVVLSALEDSPQIRRQDQNTKFTVPMEARERAKVTFNGKPLRELPGLKDLVSHSERDSNVTLPAGLYQVSQVFLGYGVQRVDRTGSGDLAKTKLCKVDLSEPEFADFFEKNIAPVSGAPLAIEVGGRLSLGDRRGYRYFDRKADIKYRYQHAQWKQVLAQLPFELCSAAEKELKIQQEKLEAEKSL